MKVARQNEKPAFVPVILTLETQAEVDLLSAIFNHSHLTAPLGLDKVFGFDAFKCFEGFTSKAAYDFEVKVRNLSITTK